MSHVILRWLPILYGRHFSRIREILFIGVGHFIQCKAAIYSALRGTLRALSVSLCLPNFTTSAITRRIGLRFLVHVQTPRSVSHLLHRKTM